MHGGVWPADCLNACLHFRALSDVKIRWGRQVVELKGKQVAWMQDGELEYHPEAMDIKSEVKAFMNEWKEKRNMHAE